MTLAEQGLSLERADAEVVKLAKSFGGWMGDYLAQARAVLGQAEDEGAGHKALFSVAHNIKGLAGSFGYSLATDIADNLCADLRRRERLVADVRRIARAHLDAVDIVLK